MKHLKALILTLLSLSIFLSPLAGLRLRAEAAAPDPAAPAEAPAARESTELAGGIEAPEASETPEAPADGEAAELPDPETAEEEAALPLTEEGTAADDPATEGATEDSEDATETAAQGTTLTAAASVRDWKDEARVSGLKAEKARNYQAVLLTWDAVDGASGYAVYRMTQGKAGLTYLGATNQKYFQDQNFPRAGFYFYWILPYRYLSYGSVEFGQIYGYVYGLAAPGKVQGLRAEQVESNPVNVTQLSWQPSEGASRYIVYRKTAEDTKFRPIAWTRSLEYSDALTIPGISHYLVFPSYEVGSSDVLGPQSEMVYDYRPPEDLGYVNLYEEDTVPILSWEASRGATRYDIYRRNEGSSEFSFVRSVTERRYRDVTAPYGEITYQVQPVLTVGKSALRANRTTTQSLHYQRPIDVTVLGEDGTPQRFEFGNIRNNLEFAAALVSVAQDFHTHYIYGSFGQPITDYIIDMKAQQYPYYFDADDVLNAQSLRDEEAFAFDCIGLMKGLLWGFDGSTDLANGGASYNSNGVPDYNVPMLENVEKDYKTVDWNNLRVGEAVQMPGHIGFYIGNGLVVEATYNWGRRVMVTAIENRESAAEVAAREEAIRQQEEERENSDDQNWTPDEKLDPLKDPLPMVEGIPSRRWESHGLIPYLDYLDDSKVEIQYAKPMIQ